MSTFFLKNKFPLKILHFADRTIYLTYSPQRSKPFLSQFKKIRYALFKFAFI